SFHSPGTCTFFGAANSDQMMMELMGLHLPNSAFVKPNTPMREALTRVAGEHRAEAVKKGRIVQEGRLITEKSIVNANV
ncbi:hypothetical protein PL75_11415, partial [Neisseria arctica]